MTGEAKDFRRKLCAWFRRCGADYPWRRTRDPYAILVSEVMLQQTQVATVLGPKRYYERWMERFPTAASLAAAPEESVLRAWEGLGYYRRARNLQRAAGAIAGGAGGVFPRDAARLAELPGVGRYTAAAVASFAFDRPEPMVDGNAARVIARLFDFSGEIDAAAGRARLWEWASVLLRGARRGRVYNSALMELGQRICTPAMPACHRCPVAAFCRAKDPASFPVKGRRARSERVEEHALYAQRRGAVLLSREPAGRRREGLWKLPGRGEEDVRGLPMLLEMKYSITKYRVTLRVYRGEGACAEPGERWVARAAAASLPMGSPYRRAMEHLERQRTKVDRALRAR